MDSYKTVMHGKMSGNILIVDDAADNLKVLSTILSEKHRISVASSASRALEILEKRKDFDIFLFDIMMPEINGIQLCRQIKSMEDFQDVPVIFISGLAGIEDKKSAFEAGGVDYIVKPFEKEEVLLRVETHLRLRKLQKELINKNMELENNYKRLRELEELRDNLTNMIIHDMRSPLTGVLSMFEILRMECENLGNKDIIEYIKSGHSAAQSLLEMINSLLDVARLEEGKFPLNIGTNSVSEIINNSIAAIAANIKGSQIVTDIKKDVIFSCDADVIKRVLMNLISNSIKHSGSNNPVKVRAETEDNFVIISVIDDGIGIPEEYHSKIFEKFGQIQIRKDKRKYSTGLGLTFCKLAVEAHGGKIWVESRLGEGSRFCIKLPVFRE
ncbi:MAG: hybrid sensor histidine kinase/response regulator [Deltaproteobacteria bacterium]|nr:hybrid sensor histidine kinase/response regulator [Deltaproteobacteria bacterium]